MYRSGLPPIMITNLYIVSSSGYVSITGMILIPHVLQIPLY